MPASAGSQPTAGQPSAAGPRAAPPRVLANFIAHLQSALHRLQNAWGLDRRPWLRADRRGAGSLRRLDELRARVAVEGLAQVADAADQVMRLIPPPPNTPTTSSPSTPPTTKPARSRPPPTAPEPASAPQQSHPPHWTLSRKGTTSPTPSLGTSHTGTEPPGPVARADLRNMPDDGGTTGAGRPPFLRSWKRSHCPHGR